jgi:hypothetical protein
MDKDLEYLLSRLYTRPCTTIVSEGTYDRLSKSYRVWALKKGLLRAVCWLMMVGFGTAAAMRTPPRAGSVTNSLDECRRLLLAPASHHELHGLVIYADVLERFVIVEIAAAHHLKALADKRTVYVPVRHNGNVCVRSVHST